MAPVWSPWREQLWLFNRVSFRHRNSHKPNLENLGDTAYNAVYIGIKTKGASFKAGKGGVHRALDAQTEKILVSVKR